MNWRAIVLVSSQSQPQIYRGRSMMCRLVWNIPSFFPLFFYVIIHHSQSMILFIKIQWTAINISSASQLNLSISCGKRRDMTWKPPSSNWFQWLFHKYIRPLDQPAYKRYSLMQFSCLLFKHHMSARIRLGRNWWWFYLCCNFLIELIFRQQNESISAWFKIDSHVCDWKFSRLNWVKAVNSLKTVFSSHFSLISSQLKVGRFHSANDFPCLDLDERWKIQSILKWILMGDDETIRWKEE